MKKQSKALQNFFLMNSLLLLSGWVAGISSGQGVVSSQDSNTGEVKKNGEGTAENGTPASLPFLSPDLDQATFELEASVSYDATQVVKLDDIHPSTKLIRMWVSIPGDAANQKLKDFRVVSSPGPWEIVHDEDHRGQFLMVSVENCEKSAIEVEIAYRLDRQAVWIDVNPELAGPLTDGTRVMFADDLDKSAPHMEVNEKVQSIADSVCGDETNIAKQAKQLLLYVAGSVDHYSYSKDPDMPKCGIGDVSNCLAQGGGCCTDLNSLFIALARARGIPARLSMGYRLQEQNIGLLVDPGYRCWVEYFVPGYGWIPADVVEADKPAGLGMRRWFTGLTPRRVWLNQGREFKLPGTQSAEPINHMSIAYAELDGEPARLLPIGNDPAQITRQVKFTEVKSLSAEGQAALEAPALSSKLSRK